MSGSSELTMISDVRLVPRNVKKERSSSSHRASVSCLISVRKKAGQRRLSTLLKSVSDASMVLYLTTLLSQSTISSMVRFQHTLQDIKRMPVYSVITTHG